MSHSIAFHSADSSSPSSSSAEESEGEDKQRKIHILNQPSRGPIISNGTTHESESPSPETIKETSSLPLVSDEGDSMKMELDDEKAISVHKNVELVGDKDSLLQEVADTSPSNQPNPEPKIVQYKKESNEVMNTFKSKEEAAQVLNVSSEHIISIIEGKSTMQESFGLRIENGSADGSFLRTDKDKKPQSDNEAIDRHNFVPKSLQEAISKRNNNELGDDGWSIHRSQSEYIGKCVRRFFPGYGMADGAVVAHLTGEENDGHPLWHIVHEDGDSEDISEDDYEVCRDMFLRDVKSAPGSEKQGSDVVKGPSNRLSTTPTILRPNDRASLGSSMLGSRPAEEEYEVREIREGPDFQVSDDAIPVCEATLDEPEQPSLRLPTESLSSADYEEFIVWTRHKFLRPGMVTMAPLPTAKIALSPSDGQRNFAEPVLYSAQRYCVIVSIVHSRLLVFDGILHHLVDKDKCSLMLPPRFSATLASDVGGNQRDSSDFTQRALQEIGEVNLEDIWMLSSNSDDAKAKISELCQDIRERQIGQQGIEIFLKLWRDHRQSLESFYPDMKRMGFDRKQVMWFYHLLLPYMCTTPLDQVCLQLRGMHRVVDMLNGRGVFLPPGYSHLSENLTSSGKRLSVAGSFGDGIEDEDAFMPQFVLPRKITSTPKAPPPKKPSTSSPRGCGAKKVEKYDLATGEALAIYDSQSQAAARNDGISQGTISQWCRGVYQNSRREFTFGFRFVEEKETITEDKATSQNESSVAENEKENDEGEETNNDNDEADQADNEDKDAKPSESKSDDDQKEKTPGKTDSPPAPRVQYAYENDFGNYQIKTWNAMYPTFGSSLRSGASRAYNRERQGMVSVAPIPMDKKSVASRAVAKCFGYYERQQAAYFKRYEQTKGRSSRSDVGGHSCGRKAVEQVDLDTGKVIAVFGSGSEASKALGISATSISCCCVGRMRHAGGFGFRFHDQNDLYVGKAYKSRLMRDQKKKTNSSRGQRKAVEQYNYLTGEAIEVFPSGSAAAKKLNLHQTVISQCCLNRKDCIGEFGFRFVENESGNQDEGVSSDDESSRRGSKKSRRSTGGRCKAIEQFDHETGESIAIFSSIRECSSATGLNRNTLALCCTGRQASIGQYGFRFVQGGDDSDISDDDSDDPASSGSHSRKVEQFLLESRETVQEFSSVVEAADLLDLPESDVLLCCIGQKESIGDFGFRYSSPRERPRKDRSTRVHYGGKKKKAVEQFDRQSGETIRVFSSGSEAARACAVSKSSVFSSCMGREREDWSFGFRFADPALRQHALLGENTHKTSRPVEMVDMVSGEVIQSFPSCEEAGASLRLNAAAISMCCRGTEEGIGDISFRYSKSSKDQTAADQPTDDQPNGDHSAEDHSSKVPAEDTSTGDQPTEDDPSKDHSTEDHSTDKAVEEKSEPNEPNAANDTNETDETKATNERIETLKSADRTDSKPEEDTPLQEIAKPLAVEQFDITTGSTLQVFSSSAHAAIIPGVNRTLVSLCCIGCVEGAGSFSFRFAEESVRQKVQAKLNLWKLPEKNGAKGKKAVEQYDINTGEVIDTFMSGVEASKATGVSCATISQCCKGRHRGHENFSFRFMHPEHRDEVEADSDDSTPELPPRPRKRSSAFASDDEDFQVPSKRRSTGTSKRGGANFPKAVVQFNLTTGEVLNVFKSGSEASRVLGLGQSNVSQCCRGKTRSAGGFGFRFSEPEDQKAVITAEKRANNSESEAPPSEETKRELKRPREGENEEDKPPKPRVSQSAHHILLREMASEETPEPAETSTTHEEGKAASKELRSDESPDREASEL